MSRLRKNCSAATTPAKAPPQQSTLRTRRTSCSELMHSAATSATPLITASSMSQRSALANSAMVMFARCIST